MYVVPPLFLPLFDEVVTRPPTDSPKPTDRSVTEMGCSQTKLVYPKKRVKKKQSSSTLTESLVWTHLSCLVLQLFPFLVRRIGSTRPPVPTCGEEMYFPLLFLFLIFLPGVDELYFKVFLSHINTE